MHSFTRWNFGAAALGLAFVVAGCSTPPPEPFQPRGATLAGYGYSEVKVDASHYSVSYSHNTAQGAAKFLELRAAQLAQGAGFHYFEVDNRGSDVLHHNVSEIDYTDVRMHGTNGTGGFPIQPRDLVPLNITPEKTSFYYSWGKVVLLTDAQALGNAKALPVSEVLARPVMAAP